PLSADQHSTYSWRDIAEFERHLQLLLANEPGVRQDFRPGRDVHFSPCHVNVTCNCAPARALANTAPNSASIVIPISSAISSGDAPSLSVASPELNFAAHARASSTASSSKSVATETAFRARSPRTVSASHADVGSGAPATSM